MLNQCIFIGKIFGMNTSDNSKTLIISIKNSSTLEDKVTLEISTEIAQQLHFIKNSLIAIKARVSSPDGKSYRFIAERITTLGGSKSGS